MSVEKAKEFLNTLAEKGADDAWMKKAAEAKTEEEKYAVAADLAREMGYDVTAADIKEALTGLNKGENDLVQLDDDAVEQVAGGVRAGDREIMKCDNCGIDVYGVATGNEKPTFLFINKAEYECPYCHKTKWILAW